MLDAEESERAVVWGYSRGARIASMVALAHPSRIDLVVLGGAPIGMPPAFAAAPAQLEALEQGDWERHWQVFPVPLPAAITGAMEQGNDPRAIGAALRAWSVDDTPWSPLPVPAIGHLGDGEVFLDTALDRARAIGIPLAVLPTGGHAETFAASTDVLAATEPYLIR